MAGEFYDHTTYPSQGAAGSSSAARAEFELIEAGFNKLPGLAGNGGKLTAINAAGDAMEAVTTTGTGNAVRANSPVLQTPTGIVKADVGLGNVDNTSDIDKPVSTAQSAADTSALNTAKAYADGLAVGLWDDRGSFNASINTYPTTGGSGAAGAILKGDIWTISVIASAGPLLGYAVGATVRAVVDTPAQVAGNWAITSVGIGYVPENAANRNAQNGYVGLIGYSFPVFTPAGDYAAVFANSLGTANRAITLPDENGLMALTSDITGGVLAGRFTTLTAGVATPLATAHVQGAYTIHRGVVQIDDTTAQAVGTGGGLSFGGKYTDAGAYTSGVVIRAAKTNATTGNYTFDTVFLNYLSGEGSMRERLRIRGDTGDVLVTSAGGLGYGIGAGGAATQATSRTTSVPISKPTGAITLFTAAGSATPTTFTVTNSLVAATDIPEVVCKSSTNVYIVKVTAVATGSFNVTFWTTGGTTSDTPVFNFSLGKGAAS